MSAPSYATGGGCDMDNAIAVEDDSFTDQFNDDLSHLFGYVFQINDMTSQRYVSYVTSKVFGGTDND